MSLIVRGAAIKMFDPQRSPIRCDIIARPSRLYHYSEYWEIYPDGTKVHRYSDQFNHRIHNTDRPYTFFRYGSHHNWFMLKSYMQPKA